jgi:Flp pilus assembly protein TadG
MAVSKTHHGRVRGGAATVELALALPVLALFFAIAVDFGRVYQHLQEVSDSARRGALYAADVYVLQSSPYATVAEAALAETRSIRDTASVEWTQVTDDRGNLCYRVTVTSQFQPTLPVPGTQGALALSRSVQMRAREVEDP